MRNRLRVKIVVPKLLPWKNRRPEGSQICGRLRELCQVSLRAIKCEAAGLASRPSMRRTDRNRATPYGILVKSEGHNCHGYSCDIICSNTGGVHRQWDVLSDEDGDQVPGWRRLDRIPARPCQAVQ
jgi:hypothetical protein